MVRHKGGFSIEEGLKPSVHYDSLFLTPLLIRIFLNKFSCGVRFKWYLGHYFKWEDIVTHTKLSLSTVAFHVETSHLNYIANKMTGFYMKLSTSGV